MAENFHSGVTEHSNMPTIDCTEYRRIVGSLLYTTTRTRPEISLSVGLLSQFLEKPNLYLLKAARCVVRYLYSTKDYSLVFHKRSGAKGQLTVYTDPDHAGSQVDRKSRSGFIATVDDSSVEWWSRKQNTTQHCALLKVNILLSQNVVNLPAGTEKYFNLSAVTSADQPQFMWIMQQQNIGPKPSLCLSVLNT